MGRPFKLFTLPRIRSRFRRWICGAFVTKAAKSTHCGVISEWIEEPLGLTGEASVRPKLLKLDDTRYRFIVIVHQGVVDGVSAYQIFPLELAALYDEFHADEPSSLPDLPIQFGDFSIWQRDWLGGNSSAKSN